MADDQKRLKVVVTRRLFEPNIERLKAHYEVLDNQADSELSRAELAARVDDADAVLVTGGHRIDDEILANASHLKLVATVSVGFNHIDMAACARRNILVTNTPDVLNETTADFGFALMMATARRMAEAERWLRAGQWQRWTIDQLTGGDVYGTTLGILGMGRIGQAIARRARGFSMPVIYHNRRSLGAALEAELNANWCSLEELLRSSDHLIVVLPYSPEVHHLIGASQLALMKPNATLVNIARGGIIDENALVAAVRGGRLGGIGLDVYEGEPNINPELLTLERAVLAPHIASASLPTRNAMANLAVDNVVEVLSGRPAKTPVTG
jgi:gluconate 2-dehydrogenase